jgi:hypothetical protein
LEPTLATGGILSQLAELAACDHVNAAGDQLYWGETQIEVDTMAEPYVLSPVVPQRANSGSKTQFSAENQPAKRGRPRGSRNKMSPALKQMIAEVAEELGRLDCRDWDKSLRGEKDGVKRFLKNLAIRELKVFGWLMCRCVPSTKRASPGRGQMQEQ